MATASSSPYQERWSGVHGSGNMIILMVPGQGCRDALHKTSSHSSRLHIATSWGQVFKHESIGAVPIQTTMPGMVAQPVISVLVGWEEE